MLLSRTYRMQLFIVCLFTALTTFGQNSIVTENSLPGNPASEWDITGAGDLSIQGFATSMSINKGTAINFKVNTQAAIMYEIKIYRLGYYQGNGARLITNLGTFAGIAQAPCVKDATTGLVDCGNWISQAEWNVPANAVSGIYIARLRRIDNGGASHIIFVVRDDLGSSPILFKTSDATWQAYNDYGGNNFYGGTVPGFPEGHAPKVSYNRPFINRQGVLPNSGISGLTGLFNAEYAMVRWLERNGYDLSYTTCVDIAKDPKGITPTGSGGSTYARKIVLSVGHDEYWSKEERTKFESARNSGVHLAFFSGNEVYWKTRWENSIDGSSTPFRTLVCYKEGSAGERTCGRKCDPLPNVWTGLWRSGCEYPGTDACNPENSLSGQISWEGTTSAIAVPSVYKNYRLWKNTSVAALGSGQSVTFPNGTLGHEWDAERADFLSTYPNRRITLSNTNVSGAIHKLSLYKHASGALVFGAGTVQWSWGLDEHHDRGSLPANPDMQQATINLFGDMGVLPGSKQSNLAAPITSTDVTAPSVIINNPPSGSSVSANTVIAISGTSADIGGEVGGVEISTDNGQTWKPATGSTSWNFSYTTPATGPVTIRARAFDDSWNVGAEATSTLNITASTNPACPCVSVLGNTVPTSTTTFNDGTAIALGMRFRSDVGGNVVGVRFYKAPTNTGVHTGLLYTNTGTLLSQVNFTNETASGWQEANFPTPVLIQPGTTYVIAYFSGNGNYSATNSDFTTAKVNPPVTGLADGTDGPNGVYLYTGVPAFPTNGNISTNYWVDVLFKSSTTAPPSDLIPPAISNVNFSTNLNGTATITWTTDELSDSRVDYGVSPSSLNSNGSIPTLTTTHSVTISGLTLGTLYYYRVSSNDAAGNNAVSPAPPADPLQFTMPKQPTTNICASDDLASEFSMGNTVNNSFVVNNDDGEIALRRTSTVEQFSRFTIPSGWISSLWNTGGTINFLAGSANLNGYRIYTTTSFNQGSTVEFSARFSAGNFQNIGFAANGNLDPYWIMIGRGNAGALPDIYARTSDGTEISLGSGLLNTYHVYQIEWKATGFNIYVDGVFKTFIAKAQTSPLIFIASDFTVDANIVSLNYFRNFSNLYNTSGTYTSRIFFLGANHGNTTLKWSSTIPTGTSLSIAVRSGNVATPDLTWSNFIPATNDQLVNIIGPYVQYRVSLVTTNTSFSPMLNDIQFICAGTTQGQPPFVTTQPSNAEACIGSVVTFSSAASGTPSPTVQWQSGSDNVGWTNIPGATSATLNVTVSSADKDTRYRAAWTNTGGTVYTRPAKLTGYPLPEGILTNGTACYNEHATLTFRSTEGRSPFTLVINGQTYHDVKSGKSFTTSNIVQPSGIFSLWDNTTKPKTYDDKDKEKDDDNGKGKDKDNDKDDDNGKGKDKDKDKDNDNGKGKDKDKKHPMEFGTKFRTTVEGTITALRFYKGIKKDDSNYKLRLYNSRTRRLIAELSYQNNNNSGWVNVSLPTPIAISPDSLYVVSYFSPNGIYSSKNDVFAKDLVNGALIGVSKQGPDGPNGVYSESGGFPTENGKGKAYYADVVFKTVSPSIINFNLTSITDAQGCTQTVNQTYSMAPGANCKSGHGAKLGGPDLSQTYNESSLEGYALYQNYPNPSTNTTVISYSIPKQELVTIMILDLYGRTVKIVENKSQSKGKHFVNVDLGNLSKGIYLYRIQAGTYTATRKMLVE